jgi:hypothetical protein
MKAAQEAPKRPSLPGTIGTYEQLMQFNQHCAEALDLIEVFGKRRMIPRTEHRYYRALLQELRAAISQTVIEHIDQQELASAAQASKERLRIEKQRFK